MFYIVYATAESAVHSR